MRVTVRANLRRHGLGAIALGLVAAAVVVPAGVASAKPKVLTNFSCIPVTEINTITKGTFGTPKKEPGYENGAGACSYSSGGGTFVIAHGPLGKSKLKNDAKNNTKGKDHFTSVSGLGSAALYGTGTYDVIFVEQSKKLYEILDNTGAASEGDMKFIAALVLAK